MSDIKVRGMILAAGYGTRLAPVTDHVPKPLLPVGDRTLLDRIIDAFDSAGVPEIGINTHHLGGMVTDHVTSRKDRDRFTLFPENEILGTGGALYGARDFLAVADHFLLHNGDVLSDVDLTALVSDHLATGAVATLLLVDWPAVNSVTMDTEGRVISIAGSPQVDALSGARNLTYAGIGVFSRKLLDNIGPGFTSLIDPLVRALEKNPDSVRGHAPEGVNWSDLGTLKRYLAAQPDTRAGGPIPALDLVRITGHGSDRQFWRMTGDKWSAVAMVSPPEDEEFERFTEIAEFLEGQNLGGPALLSVDEAEQAVLMEDLGADTLYSLVAREGGASKAVFDGYRRAVDHLLAMQSATDAARSQCPFAVDRCLDYDSLRWETDYFKERFLVGHLGLKPADLPALEGEFHALAETVAAQPVVMIHRDFQSQNIHLQDDRIRLVDFQGMRLGPLTYDLMSLVIDPYVILPNNLKAELLDRFTTAVVAANPEGPFSAADIRAMALGSGLQRVMQALGAYGFLGHVKGKRSFLDHIPAGLAILREILRELRGEDRPVGEAANRWLPCSMPVLEQVLIAEI